QSALRLLLVRDAASARPSGARELEEVVVVGEEEGVGVGVVAEVGASVAAVELETTVAVAGGMAEAEAAAAEVETAEAELCSGDPSSSSALVRPLHPSSFVSGTRGARGLEFPDATEIPRWHDLLRSGVAIFDLDFDAILAAMYAVSINAEGDCYVCVPPDPGIEAAALGAREYAAPGARESAALGAGESALSGTASAQVFHTFTLDSGASRSFFRDRTTLTPLSRPVAVSLADPSGGPVLARYSTVLPCPAAPSGSLSRLYLPLFSTNLVSGADLQDAGVDQFTPASQRVTHCTCAQMGRHLATFTRRPGSSLYTETTESPPVTASGQVAASSQVFAAASRSGPESAPCSCRLLSHQTLLWHHRLGHPSLPRLQGMASRVLVSGLPRSLPPLPPGPAPTCVPCVEGRQRAAPHSSEFPPTEAPLQTLHMDVWGLASVCGQGHERYFLLVVDDYSRYTTVFPLRSKDDVTEVLIDWIRAARLQLRERFGSDFPVLRLHSDRGGEFSSDLLRAFCRAEGIRQTFTLPASPQQNGIAERRIGMVMDVARTSMIHAAAPHFLWPFAVGDASAFRVWGSRAFVRDLSADKLSSRAVPCVFLGFPPDALGWKFYHPTPRRVLSSQDVTFDKSVPYYRLFPYRTAPLPPPRRSSSRPVPPPVDPLPPQGPAPSGVSQVDAVEPVEVAAGSGASRGAEPGCAKSGVAAPRSAESGGAGPGGPEPGGAGSRDAEPERAEPGGAASRGAEPGAAESGGVEPAGTGPCGPSGALSRRELPTPHELREWFVHRWSRAAGAGGAASAGGSAATGGTGAGGVAGAGTGVSTSSGGAGAAGPGGARSGGTGAAEPTGAPGAGAGGAAGVGATGGTGAGAGVSAGGLAGAGATGGTGTGGAAGVRADAGGAGVVPAGSGGSWSSTFFSSCSFLRAASPTVMRPLASVVTDPSFASTAASALVTELVDFAAQCRLDFATSLDAESEFVCPPSVGGECALSTDVLEDRQEEFHYFAAALPHLVSTLLAIEGDPDAPDIPTPRSYTEAIEGPYSSQWQAAMDAEMASWKSTGTYVDEVPPPGANIVSGMWIFRVKRPPGSPPVFKARYVARGFSQRQGVDYFQTFSPTPKMTTLRVLLHVAAQRDYELHSLDFCTAFLQGSLHEEIWLRRPPGFTGSFPPGTQWSLRRPIYGLRQAPREWHDTLRTTLAALGFAPSTADPSLFLHTDTSLPSFYILVYVDDLVFATADTAGLAHVKSELQKRHTCTDLGELRSYLGLQITRDRARRTITLTQSHMVQQVLQHFNFTYSSPQATPLSTRHSLSALPSDESEEPSGSYPELVGCLMYLMTCTRPDLAYPLSILARYVAPGRHRSEHMAAKKRVLRYLCSTSGLGLVLGGRSPMVLSGHADASWVDDLATQRSSHGYTFSLGSGSVLWRSTRSSSVLSSSCEAEIYTGAMAAQELRWLTYLLTDLGEPPRSPPVLYVDNKAMLALCQEHRLEHRTKHIALCYFLARELQQRGQLRLAYVASQANTADIFTKALQPCDYQRFCTMLAEPRRTPSRAVLAEPRPPYLSGSTTTATATATSATATSAMASPPLTAREDISLYDHALGTVPPPATTAAATARSQWQTRDAHARFSIRNSLPVDEREHFGQHQTAQALYTTVVARYSSPASAALGRLSLPYLFPDLSAFQTVADLITHLRTSDARFRAAMPVEFLASNPPPLWLTLYHLVTRLPDTLRTVRDHFLARCPTELTIAALEKELLAAEKSIVAVGASRGDPRTPFFEGCSPSPLLPSVASAAAVDLLGAEQVGPASAPSGRRSGRGRGGKGGGGDGGGGSGGVLGGRDRPVLTGHSDASWADDQATQRSSQGYTFSLGSGSVSWRSTRSSSVLSSSCEAEIYATAMAAQELRWLTYLLTDLGEQPRSPPVLYVDNKATIALCGEHRLEHRTKHIALRYFLARELQQRGQLCLRYVATRANTADVFTKALQPCDHQRFCTVLGLVPTVPHLLTS
ncbi:unnamed protein product, partial [Closterium sp. NIES-54]